MHGWRFALILLAAVALWPMAVNGSECDALSSAPAGMSSCTYIRTHCADTAVGLVPYLDVYYCGLEGNGAGKFVFVVGLLLMLAFLFLFIGTTAGDFFCPNLNTMATLLGLSENMTGVTFLALGNGAPDMFSTFNAMQQNYFGLAIGELLGAASFITTVVVGLVAIATGFKVAPVPFTRDILFFLFAIIFLVYVLWDGLISLPESLLLMTYYVLYVVSVGLGRFMFKKARQRHLDKARREREHWLQLDAESNENALIEDAEMMMTASGTDDLSPLITDDGRLADVEAGGRRTSQLSARLKVPRGLFLGDSATNDYDPWFNKHKTMSSTLVSNTFRGTGPASSPSVLVSTAAGGRRFSEQLSRKRTDVPTGSRPVPIAQTRVQFNPIGDSSSSSDDEDDVDEPSAAATVSHLDDAIPANYLASSISSSPSFSQNVALTSFPRLVTPELATRHSHGDSAAPQTGAIPDRQIAERELPRAPMTVTPFTTHLLATMVPIAAEFEDLTLVQKFIGVVSVIPVIVLTLTVPVVDVEKEDEVERIREVEKEIFLSRWRATPSQAALKDTAHQNHSNDEAVDTLRDTAMQQYLNSKFPPWQRWLFLCHCILSVCFVMVGLGMWSDPVGEAGGSFTWGILSVLCGAVLVSLVHFTTTAVTRPRWYTLVCFVGFLTAVIWIYLIANEVVSILQALGLIINISDAILGLTIFAIGNSVSDMVADVSVARMGFPNMAVAACFGGPMLNILLGIGFSSTYYNIRHGEPYPLKFTPVLMSSAAGVLVALCSSIIMIPLNGWRGTARYGAYLILLYAIIMVCNVSIELTTDNDS